MIIGNDAKNKLAEMSAYGKIVLYSPQEEDESITRPKNAYVAIIIPGRTPKAATVSQRSSAANKAWATRRGKPTAALQSIGRGLRKSSTRVLWDFDQLIVCHDAYVTKSNDKKNTARIAKAIGRTTGAVGWKFSNLSAWDTVKDNNSNGGRGDHEVWDLYENNRREYNKRLSSAKAKLKI